MRQFYEAYRGDEKISPLVRQLPWTHHLIILGQAKLPEERLFYMLAAIKGRWTKRELERQIQTGAIVRSNRGAKERVGDTTQNGLGLDEDDRSTPRRQTPRTEE